MKILKRIGLVLLVLGVVGFLFKDALLDAVKPGVNNYLKSFPENQHKTAEVQGSYPSLACQNSHTQWGETVRTTQKLDGTWQLEQGEMNDTLPTEFSRTVDVPGFVSEAKPRYAEVGIPSDKRSAFWYQREFTAPDDARDLAVLCLHKAKYGAKVWLNGSPLGEHYGAFTLSEYDLSKVLRFGATNTLTIRVGADHTAVPEFIPTGADLEKYAFYPGLWDSVSVVYAGTASIVRTKLETDIDRSVVTIITTIRNNCEQATRVSLDHTIRRWKSDDERALAEHEGTALRLEPNSSQTIVDELPINAPQLWAPEHPHLYLANTRLLSNGKASDDRTTRFGMRKMEWKSGVDKGFYLNNKKYYLRGTNIALHRFFEDPQRGNLPWSEAWVRELLSGHMKRFHWNSFRFHIGRAPNLWYDIADEVGLVVTDEFHTFAPIRMGQPGFPSSNNWSLTELTKEFTAWVQENWNHASIGWWDASNENHNPLLYETVPLVRSLDETRAWESGSYRAPDRVSDPLEEHPYMFSGTSFMNAKPRDYVLADLDTFDRQPPKADGLIFATWDGKGAREHAYINNEYGWLWLTRDGSNSTGIAETAYDLLAPGIDLSSEQRRELYAYVASELSGYWRAGRGYAGIQHFLYLGKCVDKDLTTDQPGQNKPSATCDNFIDIPSLTMEPKWAMWAPQAFSPVAINIDRWADDFYTSGSLDVPVTLINDTYESHSVIVQLLVADKDGNILSQSATKALELAELEHDKRSMRVDIPAEAGYVIYASLQTDPSSTPVYSRRKIGFEHPGVLVELPLPIAKALGERSDD